MPSPGNFPIIVFDDRGVCNYCNNYQKIEYHGIEALIQITETVGEKDGKP